MEEENPLSSCHAVARLIVAGEPPWPLVDVDDPRRHGRDAHSRPMSRLGERPLVSNHQEARRCDAPRIQCRRRWGWKGPQTGFTGSACSAKWGCTRAHLTGTL